MSRSNSSGTDVPKRDPNADVIAAIDRFAEGYRRQMRTIRWMLAAVAVEYIVLIVAPRWIEVLR